MLAPQTEEAYRRLRRMILSLELKPGEPLVERKLEEILAVSRTPIRAAIQQLFREGLAQRTGRVYTVAPLDLAELEEAFEFRHWLEGQIIRVAAARRPNARQLRELLASVEADLDPEVELEKATDFHLALAKLTGNRFVVASLAQVLQRIYRARYLEITRPQGADQALSDHLHLIELVQQGQAEEAASFLQKHLERSREALLKSLEGSILLGTRRS
ncbi:GntR family transcriptional regulator [Meiothermus ruber]|jgi:DNA-binding GntR family transcriptional regulator|uniref:Transcriptional regulator, GntR family n=2 Tax=Meiothermus ruber (strain ATCC 35948 / DSM 1279 / VKM B-1258 / 21) TaxID=504728 RepID=A0A806CTI2_MEIRD|nr:GntR family transcriptional regulator [Meiothermus ruber]ADD29572.1 transcriptional regulator, GntR family [Meiothermus ruber DSM 1279]MCL6530346.1 GntR family transcriptional regulator [Meiothermus ruber]MCX7803316.1 GntR family transcriptional regulator [Meiothermus ruber]GAO76489.1 GntR family transcriptional regulator [Meiothermus ruber H328]